MVIFRDDSNKLLSANMKICFHITRNIEKKMLPGNVIAFNQIKKETNQHNYTLYS